MTRRETGTVACGIVLVVASFWYSITHSLIVLGVAIVASVAFLVSLGFML